MIKRLLTHGKLTRDYLIKQATLLNNNKQQAIHNNFNDLNNFTTDGTYLYIHSKQYGLQKIGTGYNHSIQGYIYETNQSFYNNHELSLCYLKGYIYIYIAKPPDVANTINRLPFIEVINPNNLLTVGISILGDDSIESCIFASNNCHQLNQIKLITDGNYLYLMLFETTCHKKLYDSVPNSPLSGPHEPIQSPIMNKPLILNDEIEPLQLNHNNNSNNVIKRTRSISLDRIKNFLSFGHHNSADIPSQDNIEYANFSQVQDKNQQLKDQINQYSSFLNGDKTIEI